MKNSFKQIIFTALLMCIVSFGFSQAGETKRDKIDALRVAFITKKLSLTSQEVQTFWPLYNEMNDKQDATRKAFRQKYHPRLNYDFATDKEAEDYLNAELTLKQKEYELYKEYYEKFKKVLPIKKAALLKRAEEDFKKEIIKTIKEN